MKVHEFRKVHTRITETMLIREEAGEICWQKIQFRFRIQVQMARRHSENQYSALIVGLIGVHTGVLFTVLVSFGTKSSAD